MRFNLGVSIGLCGILAVAAPAFAKKKSDDLGVITVEEVPLAGVPASRTAKPAARAVKRKPAKVVVRKQASPAPAATTTAKTAPAEAASTPTESATAPVTESPAPPTESVATPQPADPSVGVVAPPPIVAEPPAAPEAPVAVAAPEVAPVTAPPATTASALAPIPADPPPAALPPTTPVDLTPPAAASSPPDAQPKRPEARFAGQLVQVTPQAVVVRALNGEMRTFARAGLKIETPRAGDMVTARFREGTDELVAVDVATP